MPGRGLQSYHHDDPLPELNVRGGCPQGVKMFTKYESISHQAQIDTTTSDSTASNLNTRTVHESQPSAQWQQEEGNSTTIAKPLALIRGLSKRASPPSGSFCPDKASQHENACAMVANQVPVHGEGDGVTYALPPQLFKADTRPNETCEGIMSGGPLGSFSADSQLNTDIHCPREASPSIGESDGLSKDSAPRLNTANQNHSSDPSDTECLWMSDCSESDPILEDRHPFLRVKSGKVRDALVRFDHWRSRWAKRHIRQLPVQKSCTQHKASRSHNDSPSGERTNCTVPGKQRGTHGSERTTTKREKDSPGLRKDAPRWPGVHAVQQGVSRRTVLSPRWPAHMPRKMR